MRFSSIFTALISLTAFTAVKASPIDNDKRSILEKKDFGPNTIFTPPANYSAVKTLYGRSALLTDNSVIATWENYDWTGENKPYMPIYRSTNGGQTWTEIARVRDQVNNWGLRFQPHLYVLPQAFGGLPAGAILLAANSIPGDLSKTKIDIYSSVDGGRNWRFMSSVASGGKASTRDGVSGDPTT